MGEAGEGEAAMGPRLTALAALLLAVLLLSGCNGSKETDEVAYVIGLGLDKAEDRKIRVTLQFALPRALGGEKGGDSQTAFAAATYTAANLAEAYDLAPTMVSRSINTSHARMFVVSAELAKEGVGDFLAAFARNRELRGTMYLLTVQEGTAAEFLGSIKSLLENLPSRYVEGMMLTSGEIGYYPSSLAFHFMSRLKERSAAPYTALVGINPLTGKGRPEEPKIPGEKSEEYTAGHIPVTGKVIPITIAGTALYREDKMVGTLTTEETRMLQILTGQLKWSNLPLVDPLAPAKPVNVRIGLREKPAIHAAMGEGRYQFRAAIHLEAEITAIPSGIHYEAPELRKQLEDWISAYVQNHITQMIGKTQELQSDVAGFGYTARHLYASYPEWRKASETWNEDYSRAEITVEVKTSLRRTGLIWQTLPIFSNPAGL